MLRLYNSLSKREEDFIPSNPDRVTVYCCGPTVYDYAHIGNFRTYTMTDFLVRTLGYLGYKTVFAMNITDVGHLVSDEDAGEDKMEKGARREGKTAWDIAKFFTDAFIADSKKLNLLEPDVRPRATGHIAEQIAMVKTLLDRGFAYTISDGIYFDTSKFEGYGALTGQKAEELKAGARVEFNPEKRNVTDFALWKFSPKDKKRDMEWDSPWGKGFPGWHIECSAMSMKYLGDEIDIHSGGMDLIPVHHTNEIAQSEAATGKHPFVRFWVHGQFNMVDGAKMSKSKGNFYRVADIEAKGYDPLSLRYLYMTAHYRSYLNFTWEALAAAAKALVELRNAYAAAGRTASEREQLSPEKLAKIDAFRERFTAALESDLNMPAALAVTWEVARSNIPSGDKAELLADFDRVLGLDLSRTPHETSEQETPADVLELVAKRQQLRAEKRFAESDAVRQEIDAAGYVLEDTPDGVRVKKKG